MTKLYLKPQWQLNAAPDGKGSLVSETMHHPDFSTEQVSLLKRLTEGVSASTLTDEEFRMIEQFSNRGFIATDDNLSAAAWELGGVNFTTVQEQFQQNTFSLKSHRSVDRQSYQIGKLLEVGGMVRDDQNPRIEILVVGSFLDLPDTKLPAIPVIIDRLRVSIGPMVFPWRTHVRDLVKQSPTYVDHRKYPVCSPFEDLGLHWVAVSILRFISGPHILYVNNTVELNVMTLEQKTWPVQF